MNLKTMTACAAFASASLLASAQLIETRAHYSTNADNAVGKKATITIDGDFSDWTEDMMIATCGANDMANAYHGSHENCVVDLYALFAAWDDSNLYLGWQAVNTGDTWARPGDGPLTDGGRIGDVPFIVAISVDPSKTGMTGKLENGKYIWMENSPGGVGFASHVDHIFYMSAKPGQGNPAMFTGNASGATNYGTNCKPFSTIGVKYAQTFGFLPSHLWRNHTVADWADAETLISDPSVADLIYEEDSYDNLMAGPVSGLKAHDTEFDTFYEMSIPLAQLGINREWLEANGIGVRVVGTRGESGMDCVPFDPSMMDAVFEKYAKDTSTTGEKDDIDMITYDLANVGKMRDPNVLPDPTPDPEPTPDPDPVYGDIELTGSYACFLVNCNWAEAYTWIWDSAAGNKNYTGGSWPGAKMTKVNVPGYGEGWMYCFTPEGEPTTLKVIFNPGGDNGKTADLDFVNMGIYDPSGAVVGTYVGGVENITLSTSEAAEYFTLQGIRVDNPAEGQIYIVRKGSKVSKQLF